MKIKKIDKRVVTKFFVNYFDLSTSYHTKLQILETLSSILSFNDEERKKVKEDFLIDFLISF